MNRGDLRRMAWRMVRDGIRRVDDLRESAWQDLRIAQMLNRPDADCLRHEASSKLKRAARLRRMCLVVADQHGLDAEVRRAN